MESNLKIVLVGLMMILIVIVLSSLESGRAKFVMCDVGQGDGLYLRTPEGRDIVIDAGSDDKILYCLGENMPFYDRYIDALLISHPHADHYGGVVGILQHYSVGKVYTPNVSNKARSYQEMLKTAQEKSRIGYLYDGDVLQVDEGTSLHIFWPTQEYIKNMSVSHGTQNYTDGDLNAFSLVVEAHIQNTYLLLTGDITKEILAEIVPGLESKGKLDILKLGHHGSKTSTTPQILTDLNPKIALISAGLHNWYHHPSREVLAMLESAHIQTFRTDLNGEEVFLLCKNGWRLQNGYWTSFFLNC